MKKTVSVPKILKYFFTEGPGIIIILAAWSLREVFFNPFVLGLKFDWSLPLFNLRPLLGHSLYAWNIENTGGSVGYYAAWLGDLFLGLVGYLGISPKVFIPIFLTIILVLAGWGLMRLCRYVHIPWSVALLAGAFYMLSPVVWIREVVGFIFWLTAYALAPFVILQFMKVIHEKKWKVLALWTGLLFALASMQIQFIVMISFILMVVTITRGYGIAFLERLKRLLVVLAVTVVFHLPWILVFLARGWSSEVNFISAGSAVLRSITDLPHSFLRTLFLDEHHITSGFFDQINHNPFVFSSGLLFLLVLLLGTTYFWKNIPFRWLIVTSAIVGFTVTILPHPHLVWIYEKIFSVTKLTNLFREVYHAQFLLSFAYALALGSVLAAFWRYFEKSKLIKIGLYILAMIVVALFCQVSLKGKYYDFGSKLPVENYQTIYKSNNFKFNFGRAWYPLGLGFVQDRNDQIGASNGDVLARSLEIPFLDEGSSNLNLPSNILNIRNQLIFQLQEEKNINQILNKVAVSKIIERQDVRSLNLGVESESNIDQTTKHFWQEKKVGSILDRSWQMARHNDSVTIYQGQPVNKISASKSVLLASGDLSDLSKPDDIIYLSQNKQSLKLYKNYLQLSSKNFEDIKASLVPFSNVTNFASEADINTSGRSGWSQGRFSWWYSADFANHLEPFVFTRVADDIKMTIHSNHTGYHQAMIRLWYSPKGGLLSIGIGDQSNQVNTKSAKSAWRWLTIEDVVLRKDVSDVELKAISGDQAVGEIVYIPRNELASIEKQAEQMINNQKFKDYDSQAKVSSTIVSPTKYELQVENNKPFLLVFSENYDPSWVLRLSQKKYYPIIVNGWANGYWIDRSYNEKANLVYSVQKWYLLGLILALISLISITTLTIYSKINKSSNF